MVRNERGALGLISLNFVYKVDFHIEVFMYNLCNLSNTLASSEKILSLLRRLTVNRHCVKSSNFGLHLGRLKELVH